MDARHGLRIPEGRLPPHRQQQHGRHMGEDSFCAAESARRPAGTEVLWADPPADSVLERQGISTVVACAREGMPAFSFLQSAGDH